MENIKDLNKVYASIMMLNSAIMVKRHANQLVDINKMIMRVTGEILALELDLSNYHFESPSAGFRDIYFEAEVALASDTPDHLYFYCQQALKYQVSTAKKFLEHAYESQPA